MAKDFDFDQKSAKVVSPIRLAHVVLRTTPDKFKIMTDFYKTFLGGEASYENEFLSFITYDEEHHRLAIGAIPGTGPKNQRTCGLEHIAFAHSSLNELLLAYRQRKAAGIDPSWCINHGPTTSIYYHDPDGNMLETQVDAFETPEEATDFMMSKAFQENPFGADFDPEEHIGRIKKGESAKSILKRPDVGHRGPESLPAAVLGGL
ncbi:Glyoxalase/Bleomycin resistance protein/Dihydroxybiphenyl dioxygenase [Mytilinidion resinicola]|uniref:Glyoxalase/Bleomycin resistance protein/Dihydroxybiphenyl dioxygenase n=1 Tax=Mytilinidion resinicola TaxID=574789 RepID=A0A6A6Y710_9PEZI|nr:Glyoxalase/Bleomycin resistance protein/Dihydroxybiphenyl dioxygenase [Mytilinidion resinicola]KAF2804611.1 Glyoxalase/Bleomycin resistance protein/Dihydroxybiphenyl dioxygenase [Mytilinidion resinicola]